VISPENFTRRHQDEAVSGDGSSTKINLDIGKEFIQIKLGPNGAMLLCYVVNVH
jgi:hypothetical protein